MDGQETPDRALVAALVDAAVTAATTERTAVMMLNARCWPGRDDRTVPAGRHWLRAWGPRPMTVVPHACDAGAQRCAYCN